MVLQAKENKKPAKTISPSFLHQLTVLQSMHTEIAPSPKTYQINEIAEISGLKDEKEVQRYLFILEGQKLVSPQPEGDFTSKNWAITKTGIKALKTISKSILQ